MIQARLCLSVDTATFGFGQIAHRVGVSGDAPTRCVVEIGRYRAGVSAGSRSGACGGAVSRPLGIG